MVSPWQPQDQDAIISGIADLMELLSKAMTSYLRKNPQTFVDHITDVKLKAEHLQEIGLEYGG